MKQARVRPRFFSVGEVSRKLEKEYGEKRPPRKRPGVTGELVRTILSQNTNDTNSGRAYSSLRKNFPGWADVEAAPASKVAKSIKVGGLANQKARRIKEILRLVHQENGGYSLQALCKQPTEEARQYLLELKGVGEKTAACVLLFSLGMPALPVDTHIYRVCKRLGFISPRVSPARAHQILEELMPTEAIYQFHINVLAHGRRVCRAQRPRCSECILLEGCVYGKGAIRATGS